MQVWKVKGKATFVVDVAEVVCAEDQEKAEEIAKARFCKDNNLRFNHKDQEWTEVDLLEAEQREIPLWGLIIWHQSSEDSWSTQLYFSASREACIDRALKLLNDWVAANEQYDSTGASVGVTCPFEGINKRSAMEILADVGTVESALRKQDLNDHGMVYFPSHIPGNDNNWNYNHYGFRLAPAFEDANWGTVAEY